MPDQHGSNIRSWLLKFYMLVLIDESGDTGFKKGSSKFFTMTLVVFNDIDELGQSKNAEHTAATIKSLKKKIGHKPEFHFSQNSHDVRVSFFQSLNENNCIFQIYSLVVEKKQLYSPAMKQNKKIFYN